MMTMQDEMDNAIHPCEVKSGSASEKKLWLKTYYPDEFCYISYIDPSTMLTEQGNLPGIAVINMTRYFFTHKDVAIAFKLRWC